MTTNSKEMISAALSDREYNNFLWLNKCSTIGLIKIIVNIQKKIKREG
jgi:hypothetical protein